MWNHFKVYRLHSSSQGVLHPFQCDYYPKHLHEHLTFNNIQIICIQIICDSPEKLNGDVTSVFHLRRVTNNLYVIKSEKFV